VPLVGQSHIALRGQMLLAIRAVTIALCFPSIQVDVFSCSPMPPDLSGGEQARRFFETGSRPFPQRLLSEPALSDRRVRELCAGRSPTESGFYYSLELRRCREVVASIGAPLSAGSDPL
jgi:hypothetical protein